MKEWKTELKRLQGVELQSSKVVKMLASGLDARRTGPSAPNPVLRSHSETFEASAEIIAMHRAFLLKLIARLEVGAGGTSLVLSSFFLD